ncbi:beta-lactamase-like protein [Trichoderma sp. SZMC 28011]
MVYRRSLTTMLVAILTSGMASASFVQRQDKLRVETHVNAGLSFNMVSSLIIGSKAAVLIDVPLAVPEANELAAWVRSTTDKPLVAVFTTHFHPDHYLSGGAFLEHFPTAKYYANSRAIEHIKSEAPAQVARWQKTLGADNIVSNTSIPTAYDHTFFTLPGNEGEHIELVGLVSGDTVDETLFWIPSTRTLIAGDTVYSHELHIWLADLQTTALTSSWIAGLELIESMKPESIVAGHALSVQGSTAQRNLAYSQSYLKFWQKNIEAKGLDFYTPEQIMDKFNSMFPGLMGNLVSATLLNITAGQFGKGGTRQYRGIDLPAYNNATYLEAWKI